MHLKVMTFNLLYAEAVNPAGHWKERLPLAVEVLKSGAEIIGLQEAMPVQLADITRELPDFEMIPGPNSGDRRLPRLVKAAARMLTASNKTSPSPANERMKPGNDSSFILHPSSFPHGEGRGGEHCAILYRAARFNAVKGSAFWLSHRPHYPGSVLHGTWLPRVVNWVHLREKSLGRDISVYNAHFDYLPWAPSRSAQILRQTLDAHWDGSTQILLGDFNAVKYSPAFGYLCRPGRDGLPPLADTWLQARERVGPERTYHGGTGRGRWYGRLDRIFCRPTPIVERVMTLTHHLGRVYPSDHYPVVAELRLTQSDDL